MTHRALKVWMALDRNTVILLWIFIVKITDVLYKKEIMTKVLKSLFPHRGAPVLRERAVDVRNPFNKSDTLFRFRIMDGRLFMRGTRAVKGIEVCKFIRAPRPHAYCRLPIPGSFATYNCTLSHGRDVTDRFKINLTMKEYPGWINPADISGYFDVTDFPKHPRLALSSVFVTEFSIDTTSSPPFENFTVFDRFKRNQTLIRKVWHNFEEFVFRKCKQDIRNLTKLVYTNRMNRAAVAVGEFDLMTLIK